MKLAIVVFDGVLALDVAGPMDVFAEANNFLDPDQQYEITLVGMRSGNVRCSNGLELNVGSDYLHCSEQPDLLLVAGGPKLPELRPAVAGGVKPLKDGVARLSKALNNKGAVWPPRGCWDVQRVRQNGGSSRTWVSQ
jgi:transcriptional regulator GlxA family with amidase domain